MTGPEAVAVLLSLCALLLAFGIYLGRGWLARADSVVLQAPLLAEDIKHLRSELQRVDRRVEAQGEELAQQGKDLAGMRESMSAVRALLEGRNHGNA